MARASGAKRAVAPSVKLPLASWLEDASLHPELTKDIEESYCGVPQQAAAVIEDAVGRIEQVARSCVAPSARAYPFGSTVNGFGEASSDLDVLIAVDSTELRTYMSFVDWHQRDNRFHKRNQLRGSEERRGSEDADLSFGPELYIISEKQAMCCAMQLLSQTLPSSGFKVARSLPRARRPLITLIDRSGSLGEVDVSINNQLPLGNTQLLKAYSLLDDRLRPIVLLVKTWAKKRGVCGAYQGNLSSYAWTIMVIYFFQLAGVLPSLQDLAEESAPKRDRDYWDNERQFDMAYYPAEKYLSQAATPQESWTLAELLYGFFRFFSQEYGWGWEVVSMRKPTRRKADAWFRLYGRSHTEPGIHVEDPIEQRDLNIVLRRKRLAQLKAELARAAKELGGGASLAELIV